MRLKMLLVWNKIFRKTFILCYLLIAFAILIYIYLEIISSQSEPTISFSFTTNDSAENLIEFTTNHVSRDIIGKILSLKRQIKTINKEQRVQNKYNFGEDIALVIVIQVYDKTYYLEQLVNSLKHVTGISKTLLIFSHSLCDDDINSVIRNISFAKVMQIFYPYTAQLHPDRFPGNDHKVCLNDLINCNKGNRDPLLMQPKHHWWWKAAFVFDEIRFIKHYNASVLFLEEDQYVTPDFFYIVKVLERLISVRYPNCDIINLGGHRRNVSDYNVKLGTVILKPWGPSDYLGVVFNRNTWGKMRDRSEEFCRYNDSRWINSLINLARKSTTSGFLVLSIDGARVFRFNECPDKRTHCHEVEKVERVEAFARRISSELFPQNLVIRETADRENIVPNGKWNDARDQELCLYYSNTQLKHLEEENK